MRRKKTNLFQSHEKLIIGAVIELFQLDQYAGADVEFTGLILGIGAPSDVTAAVLQLGAQLFLRELMLKVKPAQIVSQVAVTPDFLLHHGSFPPFCGGSINCG